MDDVQNEEMFDDVHVELAHNIHSEPVSLLANSSVTNAPQDSTIGRNSPCHCGSGKKYKHCHGKLN
jgi:preprotein translocase subunit SecA